MPGGPYGGIYVGQEYLKKYDIIFGEGTLEQLKRDVREFEVKKRTVSIESGTRYITRLSPVLNQKYSAEEKKTYGVFLFKESSRLGQRQNTNFPRINENFLYRFT